MKRLWIDDLRPAPDGWEWAKSSQDALILLGEEEYQAVSLDHDLGGDDTTRPVVLWFCMADWWPQEVYVHTANPVGREWLVGMVNRYGPGVAQYVG